MKSDIHPTYVECTVSCVCGNTFQTQSALPEIKIEICNVCHPFFTGKQKIIDTAGRVERFMRKYGIEGEAEEAVAEEAVAEEAVAEEAVAEEAVAEEAVAEEAVAEEAVAEEAEAEGEQNADA